MNDATTMGGMNQDHTGIVVVVVAVVVVVVVVAVAVVVVVVVVVVEVEVEVEVGGGGVAAVVVVLGGIQYSIPWSFSKPRQVQPERPCFLATSPLFDAGTESVQGFPDSGSRTLI